MILATSSGEFPIPPQVASRLPTVLSPPDPSEPNHRRRLAEFQEWLDASPQHTIDFERLRRWHLVQEDLAAKAKKAGRRFIVSEDGLE